MFAEIFEGDVESIAHLVANRGGDADAARRRELLESRRYVDAVSENVAVVDDDIAEIDADSELDPARGRYVGVAACHPALDLGGTLHGVRNALEFDQHSVTGRFDDPPLVLLDGGIDELQPVRLQSRERARLVGFH